MTAYYNEHDPFAAAWLRELIKAGQIAPGDVDERSIEDVLPSELRKYTQCHFFAGIGVWSYALRQAGWSDDRPVWTGSCPCQPFSAAGKRGGFADERHLWPTFYQLIRKCRPAVVFGEQVASKDGLAWFDAVYDDLEDASYAIGAADLCSAGFGAPHIRQRLYFVADSQRSQLRTERSGGAGASSPGVQGTYGQREWFRDDSGERSAYGYGLADLLRSEWGSKPQRGNDVCHGTDTGRQEASSRFELDCEKRSGQQLQSREDEGSGIGLANNNNTGLEGRQRVPERTAQFPAGPSGLVNGFWAGADWIWCRDGKYRPIEPGSPPLATGITNRVGKLRGYGNALTAEVAKGFIEAFLETQLT